MAKNSEVVMVTGAAGFVGSFLIERLLALGYTVHGLDIAPLENARNLEAVKDHPALHYLQGDIRDRGHDQGLLPPRGRRPLPPRLRGRRAALHGGPALADRHRHHRHPPADRARRRARRAHPLHLHLRGLRPQPRRARGRRTTTACSAPPASTAGATPPPRASASRCSTACTARPACPSPSCASSTSTGRGRRRSTSSRRPCSGC